MIDADEELSKMSKEEIKTKIDDPDSSMLSTCFGIRLVIGNQSGEIGPEIDRAPPGYQFAPKISPGDPF